MPARSPPSSITTRLEEPRSKNTASRIACWGMAFHLLAYYEEDCGHRAEVLVDEANESITLADVSGCCRDSIEAFQRSFGKIIDVPHKECKILCSSDVATTGYSYNGVSRRITKLFLSQYRGVLAELALTGYEYFLLIGWNGELAYGRGGETRIHLPLIPGVVMAHTHPSPICYPSAHDLHSVADFFSSSGIVEVIVSSNCASVLKLVKPLSEDDYWRLLEISERIKKLKNPEDYMQALGEVSKLSSLAFEVF